MSTVTTPPTTPTTHWIPVCVLSDLPPEQGRAALLPDGTAVALFRLHDGGLYALGNLDPLSGAPVMCHGIVGDRGGVPVVTSPLGKEPFELATGRCLDGPAAARLPIHPVRLTGEGVIEVSHAGNAVETAIGSP